MPPKSKQDTKQKTTNQPQNRLKEKDEEIERLKKELKKKTDDIERLNNIIGFAVPTDDGSKQTNNNSRETRSAPAANGTTGEGNIQDQSKEIKRLTEENKKLKEELKKPKDKSKTMQQPGVKKEDTSCSQVSLSDIPLEGLIGDSSNQTNNNSRETRSAPAANDTTGEGNIQDQSKEIKRLTLENEELNEKLNKLTRENEELNEKFNKLEKTESELKDKIEKLEETLSKTQKENTDRLYEEETKNSALKKQIEELQKTQSQEKERIEKPSAEDKKNSDLTQKIKDLENKLSQQEQESKDKLSGVEQEKTNLKREFEELQKTLLQKEKENKSKLDEKDKENSKLSKIIDDLQTEIAQLKKANKSNSPKPAASRDLKDAEEAQVKQLKENNEKLMEEKNKAVKEVDNLKNRLAEKDKENSQLTKTIIDFQTENEQLKKPNKLNSPKSAASRDLKDAEAQVKQLKEKNEKLIEEKNKAVKEVDNLKNRLSQIAGSKLTDNNPGIADLSDPNRPLNLGEKFSELYDNQWTDAMEEMTDTVDEKQAIQILLRIVDDAYKFCVKISDGYCGQIEDGITKLFNTKLSSLQKKLTKDYRKSMAVYLVSDLEEEFCKTYKYDGESVKSYQKQCIRVCWFMAVQDPKVFIDVEDVSGKKFEDDKYKHYTKTGKVTDYLVWPVLYLHKGGPMLGKGVAQGK